MRRMVAMTAIGVLLCAGDALAARRITRCCVTITDGEGVRRPYCFNLETRTRRAGRLMCRLVGGRPQRGRPY